MVEELLSNAAANIDPETIKEVADAAMMEVSNVTQDETVQHVSYYNPVFHRKTSGFEFIPLMFCMFSRLPTGTTPESRSITSSRFVLLRFLNRTELASARSPVRVRAPGRGAVCGICMFSTPREQNIRVLEGNRFLCDKHARSYGRFCISESTRSLVFGLLEEAPGPLQLWIETMTFLLSGECKH